ncbi:efflux RND transporter periplasmic adaptor subunit [Roseospira navarrensis]|uniref:HlyD family efflux transporter periplasmic adaptor subunit n=1 Tax=Roseospira navarrensis TaxID=140058 RepID=A0A7X1ZBP6_9PROT|nr:HlyD family efflux transporter periplasmic adaptor subunit [Roseospira navarrensis]MQX35600.1 HlyD family efflux transporter periplasmic adaptor subunit [Roseospira navarrensis]
MTDAAPAPAPEPALAALLTLEARARTAATAAELGFVMVNESRALVRYRQAALFTRDQGLVAVSGVSDPDRTGPFAQWLAALFRHLGDRDAGPLETAGLPEKLRPGWDEWMPGAGLFVPLRDPDGGPLGALLFVRDGVWRDSHVDLLRRLAAIYGLAWAWRRRPGLWTRFRRGLRRVPRWRLLALVLVAAVMAVPVRLSVLAPAEVVARDPAVVRAPLDGVVRRVLVEPNEAVAQGQVLFELDRTRLAGQLAVSQTALATEQARLERATQQAFADARAKADLAVLQSRIEERRAEVARLQDQLDRATVTAPRAGTAVLDDPSTWIGRPVATGERVLSVADPADVEVEAWVSPDDMIPLDPGAPVTLFLNVDPVRPVPARLRTLSYAAAEQPNGLFAHRARAAIVAEEEGAGEGEGAPPRLGLKGTARLDGETVPLGYWLLRKPLAVARRTFGW